MARQMIAEREVDGLEVQLQLADLVHPPEVGAGFAGVVSDQAGIFGLGGGKISFQLGNLLNGVHALRLHPALVRPRADRRRADAGATDAVMGQGPSIGDVGHQ